MKDNSIPLLEPIPKFSSKKCKLLAFFMGMLLEYTTFIVPLIVWYFYDFFIALLSLVLSFIIMGIIRSKMRNSSIPFVQREFQYTDTEITRWYIAKHLCFEES